MVPCQKINLVYTEPRLKCNKVLLAAKIMLF